MVAEKGLEKKDLEEVFQAFQKRQDEELNSFEDRVIHQFHIVAEGLIDQIKLLTGGHSGMIERLGRMEKENERQHVETRAHVTLFFKEFRSPPGFVPLS
jgi:hypothetical protein